MIVVAGHEAGDVADVVWGVAHGNSQACGPEHLEVVVVVSKCQRVLDPDTFVERERIQVTRDGAPLDKLNELDCTDGHIYANRFLTSEIVRIDAASGNVTDTIDASTLASNAAPDPNNVLNGIAHIPGTDRFIVGGKRWPQLYEVRFVPR